MICNEVAVSNSEQLFTQTQNRFFVNFCTLFVLLVAAFGSYARSVTIAWNPVNGRRGIQTLSRGTSRIYANFTDVGSATQMTVQGWQRGKTYYFAATAYNSMGIESIIRQKSFTLLRGKRPTGSYADFADEWRDSQRAGHDSSRGGRRSECQRLPKFNSSVTEH